MRHAFAGAACCALLLAACGGAGPDTAGPRQAVLRSLAAAPAPAVAPADAEELVRTLYLAYLGRPPEPGGLAYLADLVRQAGVPADAAVLVGRYPDDAAVRGLLDGLADSPEAHALLPAAPDGFIAAVYRNLFNRDPDPGGLAWWRTHLASGVIARGALPLVILASAAADDRAIALRKLALVRTFDAALADPALAARYLGDPASAVLREVLGQVGAASSDSELAALAAQAGERVATVPVFSQVQTIVRLRCVACHSEHPTMPGFFSAPKNTRFDTAQQIRADAYRIYVNVVQTQFMPYGNRTRMTPEERAVVKAWYESGTP